MFGDWLQDQMSEVGLTQTALAAATGATQQTVSKWVNNRSLPEARRLGALAKAIGRSVEEVVTQIEAGGSLPAPEAAGPGDDRNELADRVARLEAALEELRSRG